MRYSYGWTNERSEHISDERYDAEEAMLAPLRLQHAQEIVLSGLANRAIANTAEINADALHVPLNEGSDIMPIRKSVNQINVMDIWHLARDTGLVPKLETLFDARLLPLAFPNDPSRQLILCRSEEVATKDYKISPNVYHYPLGVQLSPTAMEAYGTGPLVPVDGLEVADLELVVRQMDEIAEFATNNDLISVDPASLIQCIGEPYYGPVNPYFKDE